MMHRLFLFVSLSFSLLPATVNARPLYEQLQLDTTKVQTILQQDWEHESLEESDALSEAMNELFPIDASGAVALPSPGGDKFVTVTDRGMVVALTDVPRATWFAPYVRDVALRNIVTGYRNPNGELLGLFGPADAVSIGQLAKMAVRTAGLNEAACPSTVRNKQAAGDWSMPFISCAETYHWTVYENPLLDIYRPATRAEVVATLLEAFEIPFAGTTVAGTFKDVTNETPFAPAIEQAVAKGIITGYTDAAGQKTGLFGPSNQINRAEVSKILSLSLQKLSK
jgi:hypothetical protein